MSRQASPGLPPEAAYPEPASAHQLTNQSAYYDPTDQRQLMADEMMEDLSRITGTAHGSGLSNGQHHHALQMMQSEQPDPESTRPITPTHGQHGMGAQNQMSSQQYGTETPTTEQYIDGNKRKRSKVSRACDECRRKKIRCDATKDDGTVETCSNCKRISTTCAFSRVPMKRGPSKGYIKELSDRVQQVETQMENQRNMSQMGPPLGFRHSLDGRQSLDSNSPGIFEGTFSPTEGTFSKKRTYSAMSDGALAAGPFSQPQYMNRDRMPSTGGWGLTSTPAGYPQGARYSIALAPDQLPDIPPPISAPLSTVDTPRTVRPFWAEVLAQDPKSDKSTDENTEGELLSSQAEAGYQKYLQHVHSVLPFLPSKSASLEKHLRACRSSGSQRIIDIFNQSLIFIRTYIENSTQAGSSEGIEEFIFTQSRLSLKDRSIAENFVLLWLCHISYLLGDNDVSRQKQAVKRYLLQLEIDISLYLIRASQGEKAETSDNDIDSDKNLACRSFNVTSILARLYSLGAGTEDLIPDDDEIWNLIADGEDIAMMSDTTAVLARYCNHLAGVRLNSLLAPANIAEGRARAVMNRRILRQQLRDIKSKLPDPMSITAGETLQQIELFLDLITARNLSKVNTYSCVEVFSSAEQISNYLSHQSASQYETANPLIPHLYVLAALTFLEFADNPDSELAREEDPAIQALGPLTEILYALQRLDPQYRRLSLGPIEVQWMPALRQLILSRHPELLLKRSNVQSTRASNAEPLAESETQPNQEPTHPATNGDGVHGVESNANEPNDSPNKKASVEGPSISTLVDAGKDLELPKTTNGVPSTSQSAEPNSPTQSKLGSSSSTDNAKSLSLAAVMEKATNSSTWQMPDFTLLGKHGWMTVLAELVH